MIVSGLGRGGTYGTNGTMEQWDSGTGGQRDSFFVELRVVVNAQPSRSVSTRGTGLIARV